MTRSCKWDGTTICFSVVPNFFDQSVSLVMDENSFGLNLNFGSFDLLMLFQVINESFEHGAFS